MQGATRGSPKFDVPNFNSRTRVGCDPAGRHTAPGGYISTHAPAWGATGPADNCHDFNSRTPRGVRLSISEKAAIPLCISTHVSREGCDDIFCMVHYCREISIPAPRKERDRPAYTPGGSYYLFNSHTPYEVRSQCGAHCQVGLSFNSRTPCGSAAV